MMLPVGQKYLFYFGLIRGTCLLTEALPPVRYLPFDGLAFRRARQTK